MDAWFRSITNENNHLEYIVPKKDAIIADAVCYIHIQNIL